MLALYSRRVQWAALALILIGYWGAFALYQSPGPEFDFAAVGVPPDWPHHPGGFAAHWDKNSNLAWAFDTWFLNLFPREKPFTHNGGGYATLSFIPTLATMILGLLAGGVLRRTGPAWGKVLWLAVAAGIALAAGWGLGELGVCPVVKRIWTPSWVLYSGGWCFLFLAVFYAILDVAERPVLGLSAPGHRHEFDRRLLHGRCLQALHRTEFDHPSGEQAVRDRRPRLMSRSCSARACSWCSG